MRPRRYYAGPVKGMDEEQRVTRMAKAIIATAAEYIDTHEDFSEIVKRRPTDVTRKIDLEAEKALDNAILREGIRARVISEELGERIVPSESQPECTLVLDPIDGSMNSISGIPYFCTSLAMALKDRDATFGDVEAAAVASIASGTFSAKRNNGAKRNDTPIKVRENREKPRYGLYTYNAGPIPRGVIALQEERCVVRTMGSIALDLCMLAWGSLDAVVDTRNKLSGYDIMAGVLILQEAGGVITDAQGRPFSGMPVTATGLSIIAAASKERHELLLSKLSA